MHVKRTEYGRLHVKRVECMLCSEQILFFSRRVCRDCCVMERLYYARHDSCMEACMSEEMQGSRQRQTCSSEVLCEAYIKLLMASTMSGGSSRVLSINAMRIDKSSRYS